MYSHYLHNRDILAGYSTIPAPNEGSGFEDLLANIAAEHFPLYDEKVPTEETLPISALSPITMSSGTSSVTPSPSTHSRDIESDVDPDSDVEELDLQDPDPSGDNARLPSPSCNTFQGDGSHMPVCTSGVNLGRKPKRQQQETLETAAYPPPVVAVTSSRSLTSGLSHCSLFSADDEREPDNEFDGDATDEEYVPSPALPPRKRQRASPTSHERKPNSPNGRRTPPNDLAKRPTKRPRAAPSSRNRQTDSPATIESAAKQTNADLVCPECGWKQFNRRLPDFKRHLRTHTRPSEQNQSTGWWCKGVPLDEAAKYDVPNTTEPYLFLDEWRVGGCQRTFARRDALKRHLDNPNVTCLGRPSVATEN